MMNVIYCIQILEDENQFGSRGSCLRCSPVAHTEVSLPPIVDGDTAGTKAEGRCEIVEWAGVKRREVCGHRGRQTGEPRTLWDGLEADGLGRTAVNGTRYRLKIRVRLTCAIGYPEVNSD